MNRILGIDLGTNSIGWALINKDRNEVIECGSRIISHRDNSQAPEAKTVKEISSEKRLLDFRVVFAMVITVALFLLSILNQAHWQYWLNLGIGGVFVLLSLVDGRKG